MRYITSVEYEAGYRLRLRFEDGCLRRVDLAAHLDGEMFEPLRDVGRFKTARLNSDIDTVVWDNGADMSPDFLYDISSPTEEEPAVKVAEDRAVYGLSNG
jgi:hypothetical protein